MKRFVIAAILLHLPTGSFAQSHQPYAGFQSRDVKALSNEQMADLRAGRGMGLALAAELNGYPGPAHILEMVDALALTSQQRVEMQSLFDHMKAETVRIGSRLIQEETALDREFAGRNITAASLVRLTGDIGKTQAELRAAHLRYHLSAAGILTPEQMGRYAVLRGYGTVRPEHGHHRSQ